MQQRLTHICSQRIAGCCLHARHCMPLSAAGHVGTIPPWGSSGGFPSLQGLYLNGTTGLTGTIPASLGRYGVSHAAALVAAACSGLNVLRHCSIPGLLHLELTGDSQLCGTIDLLGARFAGLMLLCCI